MQKIFLLQPIYNLYYHQLYNFLLIFKVKLIYLALHEF
jgi:hypothetical protein